VAETRKKKTVYKASASKSRKQKQSRGSRNAKKAKKGVSPEIWQALLLTVALIVVSVVISITVFGIKRNGAQFDNLQSSVNMAVSDTAATETATPENPPVQDESVVQEIALASEPVQKKQNMAASVSKPKTAAEKTPAAKPENRMPAKTNTPGMEIPAAVTLPELPPKPVWRGTLAFIIDDAGNNLRELEPFLRFPGPLTIAVLPGLPYSAEAARRIRAAGKEVFLHQPMEALGGQEPGPGAIYSWMNTAEILEILNQNLAEIGPVAGINNHQGSKITMDRQAMETVLTFCRDKGIYFLDSRTTAETAVPAAARNLGIKTGQRNIFIDNEQSRSSMNRFIESGLTLASQNGSAVMIGHVWSPELAPLLEELYHNFIDRGYTLSIATKIQK
jgi:polysaccharide deacetylase 2 family uncharacterized protein YibQ